MVTNLGPLASVRWVWAEILSLPSRRCSKPVRQLVCGCRDRWGSTQRAAATYMGECLLGMSQVQVREQTGTFHFPKAVLATINCSSEVEHLLTA